MIRYKVSKSIFNTFCIS